MNKNIKIALWLVGIALVAMGFITASIVYAQDNTLLCVNKDTGYFEFDSAGGVTFNILDCNGEAHQWSQDVKIT